MFSSFLAAAIAILAFIFQFQEVFSLAECNLEDLLAAA